LRNKLWESDWHERVKALCIREIENRGIDSANPQELLVAIQPEAMGKHIYFHPLVKLGLVGEGVKHALLAEIEAFVNKCSA
jgi:hypothetical protein